MCYVFMRVCGTVDYLILHSVRTGRKVMQYEIYALIKSVTRRDICDLCQKRDTELHARCSKVSWFMLSYQKNIFKSVCFKFTFPGAANGPGTCTIDEAAPERNQCLAVGHLNASA